MNLDLIRVRVISFLYGIFILIAGALLTAVFSAFSGPEFQALVTAHFGDGAVASFIFLIVQQIIAHLRNLSALKKYKTAMDTPAISPEGSMGATVPRRPVLI